MLHRRTFLQRGAAAAVLGAVAWPRLAQAVVPDGWAPVDSTPRADDPVLRDLAMRALDAAKSAGASYADVRLTVKRTQTFTYANAPTDGELIGVGVRALVDGCWGFAASSAWTPDEVTRVGTDAVGQARDNAWPGVPRIELAPVTTPATGTWIAPVRRDPFSVSVEEKLDLLRAVTAYASSFRNASITSSIVFERLEKTFASTEGAFFTQTTFNTLGNGSYMTLSVADLSARKNARRRIPLISASSAGYEVIEGNVLFDLMPHVYEEAREQLVTEPVMPGRYDVVFDGRAMSALVDQTLAVPLELDRVLGLEANASGTSYLSPVSEVLGSTIGPASLQVTANRSDPTGAATVRWDDDGVEPAEFSLVEDGRIVDYMTSREHTLPDGTGKAGSRGCLASGSALDVPLIHTPNIHMQPAASDTSLDALIANVENGYLVTGGNLSMDQQQLTGQGRGDIVYRIKEGKRGTVVSDFAYLLRSPEIWKNLQGVGGASTVATQGFTAKKGEPAQQTSHSVTAPAAHVSGIIAVDLRVTLPGRLS